MNSIPGEFANFLWYASALGGWLVPTYNSAAFSDHPRPSIANRPTHPRSGGRTLTAPRAPFTSTTPRAFRLPDEPP
ncbi:hypothetical protein NKH18_47705 [Streptomyces sp. M10(2022)]